MGKSIFDIDRELLDIFEELEENGGELTPEIEEKLKLNEEEREKSNEENLKKAAGLILGKIKKSSTHRR